MYRDLSNTDLENRLREVMEELGSGPLDFDNPGVRRLVDTAYKIRMELERRGGWHRPEAGVNFETYVTD